MREEGEEGEEGKIHVEVFVIGLIVALSYARAAFLLVTG